MKKNKLVKWIIIVTVGAIIVAGGVFIYLWNMPHRDVQAASVDFEIEASRLVQEYLADEQTSNNKYLQEEGDSKILAVKGTVYSIGEDMNRQKVIILKEQGAKAGVSCTFTSETNAAVAGIQTGQIIFVKGVIRSGASYDKDLEMYEDVIMEKCNIISK